MNVLDAIKTKRAIRLFKDQTLPEEIVQTILNAGRLSQSSKNMQPWNFIAIQDKTTLKALSELGDWAGHLAGAALGVAIITVDPASRFSVMFDSGQSAAYMQLAAWDMDIGSCLATIYERDKARQLLGFPDDMHIRIAISFGYPAESSPTQRPPRKDGRRQLDDIVHWEKWNA